MTGPEHYQEAERIGEVANGEPDPAVAAVIFQHARLHATLALAAATAMAGRGYRDDRSQPPAPGMHVADFEAWDNACGVAP